MAKPLDLEEIAELRNNIHVVSINGDRIKFTPTFKELAYRELQNGKSMRTIFAENGIDPEILGYARIHMFTKRLREKGTRVEGFEDLRTKNIKQPTKETKEHSLANRVEQLEHELAYTRQELDFVKKIHLADLEARKRWESKHHQK